MSNKKGCCCGILFRNNDDNENKKEEESTCEIEKKFAATTSCHGVSYWCDSQNNFQRIAWIILVFDQIDFPAVTICNYNRYFAASQQEIAIFQLINKISSPLFLQIAQLNNLNFPASSLGLLDAISNFSTSNLLDVKGYQLKDRETLLDCWFEATRCTASDFTPVLTKMGKCYTFNGNTSSNLHQTVAGFGQGFSLSLNVQQDNYTEEPLYGKQEAGIMFQIHPKYETPQVHERGIAVPVGKKAFALITRQDSEIIKNPWGQCHPSTQKVLKYFSTYTLTSCMLECYTDYLIARCGCRTFYESWASSYASECTPEQLINCTTPYLSELETTLTPNMCQCTIPCSFTEYTTVPSYATAPALPTRQYFETITGYDSSTIMENIAAIELTYAEIGYTKSVQSKKIDETGLMSDIGGQLGLWIGMSFLTVAEILQYLILRAAAFIKSLKSYCKKDKNSVEAL